MSVQKIIDEIESMAPFSQSSLQIIEMMSCPESGSSKVARVVKKDANLAANVLRLANSSFFGLKQKVDSIDHAVTIIGSKRVLEIALYSMTSAALKKPQLGYALKGGELWRHTVIGAAFAREIAIEQNLDNAEVVFTAALIKDLGKVILSRHLAEAEKEIDQLVFEKKMPFCEAEKKILGIDHAELAAIAFERWSFPENLIHVVRNHHLQKEPVIAPKETCIVFLGDVICSILGIGSGKDGLAYRFSDDILLRYFDIHNFHNLVSSLFSRISQLDQLADLL
ncbi:MAG: HDOD domain-containing protein [Desulfobacteraceae bacterium]|nr:HDOD domain-containing protein [Desulfobacteraceae bacterium]